MSAARNEEVQRLIYDGATVTTLGEIFGLDHKEVNKRIAGRVQPKIAAGTRVLTYRIRDVAPYLCDIKTDPEEMIKNLSPSKLPPALQDAFWKAQNSRQKWEESRGDLWRTSRVFEAVAGAFKVVRLTILMFADTVSQRTDLSPEQRRIIQELGDSLLNSLSQSLREEFAFYVPKPDEHGMPLTDQDLTLTPGEEADETEEEVDPFA